METKMVMSYDLSSKYNNQKSFNGKAKVEVLEDNIVKNYCLKSYDTLVAIYTEDKLSTLKQFTLCNYNVNGKSKTQTTTKHQKEFFKQFGLDDEEIKELFKNGILEKR